VVEKARADYYLQDLGPLVLEMAFEARDEYKAARGTPDDGFLLGRLTAFSQVVTLMQQQALGFGIPLEDLRLDSVDADKDLT
jgi:hypothetical protein